MSQHASEPSEGEPHLLTQAVTLQAADKALASKAAHDTAAFAELYRRHADRVYRYLLVRTGNVQDAQELTAETFLAALKAIARYRGEGEFSAWLLGIARHQVARYFRGRRETMDLDDLQDRLPADVPFEEHIADQLEIEHVIAALRRIAPERAEALALRVLAELSAAEVGQLMGKSETAVRMLVHRALRDLRKQLALLSEGQP